MAEYIERGALMAALCEKIVGDGDYYSGKDAMQDQIRDMVSQFPQADAAPVRHGRWIDRIVDENEVIQPWVKRYYCSECLEGGSQSWFKFCPNCGAKMDKEETT